MHDSYTPVALAKALHASFLNLLMTINHPKRVYCEDTLDILVTALCGVIRRYALKLHLIIDEMHHSEKNKYFSVKQDIYNVGILTRAIENNTQSRSILTDFVNGLCETTNTIVDCLDRIDMEAFA